MIRTLLSSFVLATVIAAGLAFGTVSSVNVQAQANKAGSIRINRPPIANPDTFATLENQALTTSINSLLANDSDPDGDAISFVNFKDQPLHGTLSNNGNGTFTYTPSSNYSGTDSFTYIIKDPASWIAYGTVNINVSHVNHAPVAMNDTYTIMEDATLLTLGFGLLVNDFDLDGDHLFIATYQQPAYGSLVMNPDGNFIYTPYVNFYGVDTFNYTISDGNGGFATATAIINVVPVNDAPVAANDMYSVLAGTTLTVSAPGVLANDTDVDGGNLSVSVYSQPTHGTLTLNANGSFTYIPAVNYVGNDSFTYTVEDGNGGNATATVTITVTSNTVLLDPIDPIDPIFIKDPMLR